MRSSSSLLLALLISGSPAFAADALHLAIASESNHQAIEEQLRNLPRYTLVHVDRDDLASQLRLAPAGCAADVACLARLDAYRGVDLFLSVREERLGQGVVLDVSLLTADGRLLDRRADWMPEEREPARRARLAAALSDLLRARDLEWSHALHARGAPLLNAVQPPARSPAPRRRL